MTEDKNEFVTYREFGDKAMTRLLTDILDENNIPYQVEDNSGQMDSNILGTQHIGLIVKIESKNFDPVNKILEAKADEELESVEKDYFLFEFSDEELKDVLVKASEWSHLDVALAQKVLRDRGVEFSKDTIMEMREKELEESAKPEKISKFWINMAYFILFCLLVAPFVQDYFLPVFVILIPFIMGLVFLFYKKVDLSGRKIHAYDKNTRKHGKNLSILGGVVFVIYIILRTTYHGTHLYDYLFS